MAPRGRPQHLALEDIATRARELAGGLKHITSWLRRDKQESAEPAASSLRKRGRPSRAETLAPEIVEAAPIPELVLAPADRVGPVIRSVSDQELLREAYAFEQAHDGRKTVLDGIEQRLRLLGEPLEKKDGSS